ncbi:hypothetical protein DIPPA_70017 [Diplonema papillatum]|nr:hypothetical protein DIPPA_70017 [Diplonema papillatum]
MFSHVVRKRKKEEHDRNTKRFCPKAKDVTTKLLDACETKRATGLRFKKTMNLKNKHTVRLQKTAWSTSEDEGALWDVQENTWDDTPFPSMSTPEGIEELRSFYKRLKDYLVSASVRVSQSSGPHLPSEKTQLCHSQAPTTMRAASAIVSWRASEKRVSISTCTLKSPPTVTPTPSSTGYSLTEATTAYEYEGVIAHYEKRLEAMYALYKPDGLRDLPGVVQKYSLCLDQVIRVMVEKYGPEPGKPPPPTIDHKRRFEAYLMDVAPEKLDCIPSYLGSHEGQEEYAMFKLILCIGQRERFRPEEAFKVQNGITEQRKIFYAKVAAYLRSVGKGIRVENDYLLTLGAIFSFDHQKCIRSFEAL